MWFKFFCLIFLSFQAQAYRFTTDFEGGFYWAKVPISITVIDHNDERREKIESLALAAIDDWQTNSGLSLWDYSGSGTKNVIRWSENFAQETKMDPNTVLAVAIRYTDGPYFAKTEIVINGSHTYNQNESLLRTTLTHELGHTMGLDHSQEEKAVMAPTLQPWYTGLHADDLAGIKAAFQEMEDRQIKGYISPLAYERVETSSQPVSCGTIGLGGQVPVAGSFSAIISLISGLLISFIRKWLLWFKSRF